jgi:hydrogenase expression/formation protein HypE
MSDLSDSGEAVTMSGAVCPRPLQHDDRIVMGHGSGGRMSHDLIRQLFLPPLGNPILNRGNDAGLISFEGQELLAISTDSHVVWPLFFPGGDIGKLAVCGTVNDVAMMGADPRYLTAGFILEEGFEVQQLRRIVASMQAAAGEAGVQIVAGDTKVVQRGKADGLYINTAGVGRLRPGITIGGDQARPGDVVLLSGPIGDHGIAVLGARGELGFDTRVESDIAPLNHLVAAMLEASDQIHVLRDPTRGGVASTLNEIASQSQVGIILEDSAIPVRPAVMAACELLGFDPLYIANEGKLLAIVSKDDAQRVLEVMRITRYGEEARIVGRVSAKPPGRVLLQTTLGSLRVIDKLAGEMLPRIC